RVPETVPVRVPRVVEGQEEQRLQSRNKKVVLGPPLAVPPQSFEVVGIPTEGQPPLPLEKVDEHEPVEEELTKQSALLLVRQGGSHHLHDPREDRRILLE